MAARWFGTNLSMHSARSESRPASSFLKSIARGSPWRFKFQFRDSISNTRHAATSTWSTRVLRCVPHAPHRRTRALSLRSLRQRIMECLNGTLPTPQAQMNQFRIDTRSPILSSSSCTAGWASEPLESASSPALGVLSMCYQEALTQ